jgi:hypothetical protein
MRANTGDVRTGLRGRIVGVLGLVRTPCTVLVRTPCTVLSGPSALPSRAESLRLNRRPTAEQTAACIVSGGTAGWVLRLAESLRLNRLRASGDMEGGRARCVQVDIDAVLVDAVLVDAVLGDAVLVDIDAAASSRRSSATTSQGSATEFMTHTNANTYTSAASFEHVLCGMRGTS